jgi:hypothetical protein
VLRFAQNLLWRVYQMGLIILGLAIFWGVVGQKEDVWLLQVLASFAFAGFFSLYVTTLTCRLIDAFRRMHRNKSAGDFA